MLHLLENMPVITCIFEGKNCNPLVSLEIHLLIADVIIVMIVIGMFIFMNYFNDKD